MTNREWLKSLDDEEFVKILLAGKKYNKCYKGNNYCFFDVDKQGEAYCRTQYDLCRPCVKVWLDREHKEQENG